MIRFLYGLIQLFLGHLVTALGEKAVPDLTQATPAEAYTSYNTKPLYRQGFNLD